LPFRPRVVAIIGSPQMSPPCRRGDRAGAPQMTKPESSAWPFAVSTWPSSLPVDVRRKPAFAFLMRAWAASNSSSEMMRRSGRSAHFH
jgi:hypothetical protein